MKIGDVFSTARNIIKYFQTRKKRKLYHQWVERDGLPPDAVPQEEVAVEIAPKLDERKLNLYLLYLVLGALILLLILVLILLIAQQC